MSEDSYPNMSKQPLVSVGLPTFNRARTLKRAIESVLGQSYTNLELVISDNASTDGTKDLCEQFSRIDRRIKYLRQPTNQGAAANFRAVLDHAQGEFFMWLADDDWLDQDYIFECTRVLAEQPDHEHVCGRAAYYKDDELAFEEDIINLLEEHGHERVLSYFQRVNTNGMFYGVARRNVLSKLEVQNTLGADWLLIANLSFLGKIRTLDTVHLNRSMGGASQQGAEIVVSIFSLPAFMAIRPFFFAALIVFRDVAWKSSVYNPLPRRKRISLAAKSAVSIIRRFKAINSLEKLIELSKSVSEFICAQLMHLQAKLI